MLHSNLICQVFQPEEVTVLVRVLSRRLHSNLGDLLSITSVFQLRLKTHLLSKVAGMPPNNDAKSFANLVLSNAARTFWKVHQPLSLTKKYCCLVMRYWPVASEQKSFTDLWCSICIIVQGNSDLFPFILASIMSAEDVSITFHSECNASTTTWKDLFRYFVRAALKYFDFSSSQHHFLVQDASQQCITILGNDCVEKKLSPSLSKFHFYFSWVPLDHR